MRLLRRVFVPLVPPTNEYTLDPNNELTGGPIFNVLGVEYDIPIISSVDPDNNVLLEPSK
jgi:hypothetical protein